MVKEICYSIASGLVKGLFYIILFCLIIVFIPNLPPHVDYKDTFVVQPPKPLEGKLALNGRLQNLELWHKGKLAGPEAFAVHNGELYTGLANGEIVKVTEGKITPITRTGRPCSGPVEARICGRPLGLKFDKNGALYVADAYYGILKVDVKTGQKQVIVSPDDKIGGKESKLFDAIDIASNGDFFWTDASTQFYLEDIIFDSLADPSGRLVHYNAATKQNKILIDKLHFGNGVVLSEDETEVLVAETFRNRIHRYYLKGPKAGSHDIFLSGLPGLPDNINRDGKGGYLIPLVVGVDEEHSMIFNTLSPYPLVRKLVSRIFGVTEMVFEMIDRAYPKDFCLKAIHFIGDEASLGPFLTKHRTTVLHVSRTGEILDSLHTITKPQSVSEAYISNDTLYLGSPYDNHIGRIKLFDVGWEHLAQERRQSKTK